MGERKRQSSKSPKPRPVWRPSPRLVRLATLTLLAAGTLVGGGWAVWRSVRTHVLDAAEYRLSVEQVTLTPPPPWIRADLRRELLSEIAFNGSVSILDDEVVERVAQACALHPWVARVERVRKFYPARLDIALEYRRPVMLVEAHPAWQPVDATGVLLPSLDFAPSDLERYPRLTRVRTAPLGSAGTPWGDPLVADAAQIAEVLEPVWQELHLAELRPFQVPIGVPHSTDLHDTFELLTQGQTRIIWGHAPASTTLGEANGPQKLARLRSLAQEGALDGPQGAREIDLRAPAGPVVGPRTAARP